ncbi:MAG TPA: isoprenylcysteine carboxylmethyltransferase family protein [Segetibacter sp.]
MKKVQLALCSVIISQVIPLVFRPELILHYKNLVLIAANIALWLFQPAVSAKETSENRSKDRYSVVLIIVMSMLSTIVPIVDWAYLSGPEASNTTVTIIGFIVLWSGVMLRNYSIKILGKHFTATIQLQNNHMLITKGPYSVIRHPSYLGAMIALAGSAIFLNSLTGTLTAITAMMVAYLVRINAEEKMMSGLFGNEYRRYQKKTSRLIPFFW